MISDTQTILVNALKQFVWDTKRELAYNKNIIIFIIRVSLNSYSISVCKQ